MKIIRRYISPAERARILARSGCCCAECGTPQSVMQTILSYGRLIDVLVMPEYDHIIPLAAGGADVEGNMQALCKKCHKIKTALDARAIAKTRRMYQKLNRSAVKKVRKWKRTLQSRGFQKQMRKRFDGTVEPIAESERRRARDKKFMTGKHW